MELQFRTKSILAAQVIGDGQAQRGIEILNKFDGALFNITDQLMLGLLRRYAVDLVFALSRRTLGEVTMPRNVRSDANALLVG